MRSHLLGLLAPGELLVISRLWLGSTPHAGRAGNSMQKNAVCRLMHCSALCVAAGSEPCMGHCSGWPCEGWVLGLRCRSRAVRCANMGST